MTFLRRAILRFASDGRPASATSAGKDYLWLPGTYEPLARVDFAMSDSDNGNVLRVTKSSPNVHLDWSLDGTSGPFVLKRSLSYTFSNPVYLGPAQTAQTFNDAVLTNSTSYAYEGGGTDAGMDEERHSQFKIEHLAFPFRLQPSSLILASFERAGAARSLVWTGPLR